MNKVLINMNGDKKIPEFTSYEEMAEFWDRQDLGDYWDQTESAKFEMPPQARRRYLVGVEVQV
jgi:hypothetical protein